MGRVFLKDLDFKMIKLLYVDVAEVNKPNLLLINLLAINAGNKVSTNTLIVVSCVIALNNPHKYHYTSLCEVIEKSLAVIFFSSVLTNFAPPIPTTVETQSINVRQEVNSGPSQYARRWRDIVRFTREENEGPSFLE